MNGRIEELATPEKPGRIATNSGPAHFRFSYRHTVGTPEGLAIGQLVSFEPERSAPEFAVGVRPNESVESPAGDRSAPREIRYQGFEQTRNIRTYKFQAWRSGEENVEAIVTVDLALFRRHGVGIQEGPGICLRLLKAEFRESGVINAKVLTRTLSDLEMLEHLANQPASKNSRRKRP